MDELKNALEVRKRYNDMSFEEFVNRLEEYISLDLPKEELENFKFTGLNNVDLFSFWVD